MKTDAQLKEDVLSELRWEPSVNAARIQVEVISGTVTLAGNVDTYVEKSRAGNVVRHIAGVKDLFDRMDVELVGTNRRADADLARSARTALQWTTYVENDAVRVVVHDGHITLSGELDWDWQRQGVVSAVRHLIGVTAISDRMLIKFRPSSSVLQGEIESALSRRAISDVKNILVKVRGTCVTLSGTAHSWYERELAANCVWCTPGVRSVADNITVT